MKTPVSTPPQRTRGDKNLLDRDAWLNAAADVVANDGFAQLKILALAKTLGVTRGSFYWHFKDHAEFVDAFLEKWCIDRINEGISYRHGDDGDALARLYRALELSVRPEGDMKSLRIELAVRDLARRHALAARLVTKLDKVRWKQAFELFHAILQDEEKAWSAALMFNMFVAGGKLILPSHLGEKRLIEYLKNILATTLLGRAQQS